MGYIVINDAHKAAGAAAPSGWDPNGESEELGDLDAAVTLATGAFDTHAEPLRVVHAETGRTLLYFGHAGYRCVNRAAAYPRNQRGADGFYQLDGGFSRPYERLVDAIARAASEYMSCLANDVAAEVEVVDGAGRVFWSNGRPR